MKEFDVLLMLVQNEDRELTNEEIYLDVWGAPMNNEENAVDFAVFTKYDGGYMFAKM